MRTTAITILLLMAGCAGPAPDPEPDPASSVVDLRERRLNPEGMGGSEVSIAANPKDPKHLVASSHSNGGFGVYWTRDAGNTWESSIFSASRVGSVVEGRSRYLGLSDPAVAFGPDGRVYLAGLAVLPASGVFVARSDDGGATWPQVAMVHESDIAASFNDKEWIGVSRRGTVVVVWQKEPLLDSLRSVDAATGIDADVGNIVFSRSVDGGRTWSLPSIVSRGLHNNGTQVLFTPDGRGHMLWVNYETRTLDYVVSTDDGASWSAPRPMVEIKYSGSLPRFSRMHTLPGFAASPDGQVLAAVWHDVRNVDLDVYVTASFDGGATWTPAVRAHDDAVKNGAHQMYPWIAVDPERRIHVTYYDSSEDPEYPRFRFFHASTRGDGILSFNPAKNASSTPFTAFSPAPGGPSGEGRSLGDYTGLAASSEGVFPVWADGRERQSVIYAAKIPLDYGQTP